MMERPDLSRLPQGQRGWGALIRWLAETDDREERHFLEVKGPEIDLSSKEGRAKVAKFVLGAANRDPDKAAAWFDGYGVLVVGVAHGAADGVAGFEAQHLEENVTKYIGDPGPEWDFDRIPARDGRDYLIVKVAPPRAGDTIWPCRADGPEKLFRGRIYIRAEGATREAREGEVDMLVARARAAMEQPDIDVKPAGAVHTYFTERAPLDEYIARKRQWLLDGLPTPPPSVAALGLKDAWSLSDLARVTGVTSWSQQLGETPENRTEETFRSEVAAWAVRTKAGFDEIVEHLIAARGSRVTFQVVNNTEIGLEDVHVEIHLEGAVRAVEGLESARLPLPTTPRTWGPRPWSPAVPQPARYAPTSPAAGSFDSRIVSFENGGSVDISFAVPDLRPHKEDHSRGEIVLVPPGSDPIRGAWTATAKGVRGRFGGEFCIPVSGSRDLTPELAKLLEGRRSGNGRMK